MIMFVTIPEIKPAVEAGTKKGTNLHEHSESTKSGGTDTGMPRETILSALHSICMAYLYVKPCYFMLLP